MANIPPLKRFGGVREIKKRVRGSELLQDSRDALAQHLIDLGTVNIDEIMEYENRPHTEVRRTGVGDETTSSTRHINMLNHWTANPNDEVDPAFVSLTAD